MSSFTKEGVQGDKVPLDLHVDQDLEPIAVCGECGEEYANCQCEDGSDEDEEIDEELSEDDLEQEAEGIVETATAEPIPPSPPLLVWYDSKSHQKRRYFSGVGGYNRPLFVYDPLKAKVFDDVDNARLASALCYRCGYNGLHITGVADAQVGE